MLTSLLRLGGDTFYLQLAVIITLVAPMAGKLLC